MKWPVQNLAGETVGEIDLPDHVFGQAVNDGLIHQAVTQYLANQRVGTAATKTRAMVKGGGRKPWRQKGTGRARQGSTRAAHWRKGGIVFGPHPRDYRQEMPKRMRRKALCSALSGKVASGDLIVIDDFRFAEPKTRLAAAALKNLGVEKALVLVANLDHATRLSVRNIEHADTCEAKNVHTYLVVRWPKVIITREAAEVLGEVLA